MAGRFKAKATEVFKRPDTRDRDTTHAFWRCLSADPKCMTLWRREAERAYRRTFTDEPFPGIWPWYTARLSVGINIFQALEARDKIVPKGFLGGAGEPEIQQVDCYAIAERLLNDEMVRKLGDGPARQDKKVRAKRIGR
jgi:hypothetical protein